ncbi:MAG: PQQ-dependent sugar dehydrogenase [Chloroflexi bacterium]|nr:PQQ-dependent sugar dehydrogenase [Chloroflexota bacterium]
MRARVGIVAFGVAALSLTLAATACGDGENPFGVTSELVTEAERPAAMAFAPDGRLFYAEQFTGNIRVVDVDGQLLEEPFAHVDVATYIDLDWGLTGLALDPDFETNHYVYAFLTQPIDPETPVARPLVVRFTDQDNQGMNRRVIIGDLPETFPASPGFNANGSLHFGPDGFLYLSLGDYDTPDLVQDLTNPIGKMLRVSKEDGTPAEDNPFLDDPEVDPRIFAHGFREPFDFAFHPETGQVYGSDNTTVSCEALNLITAAGNYRWPDVGEFPYSDCQAGEGTDAIHLFAKEGMEPSEFLSFVVVSGLEFASADIYPLLGDALLVCESETKLMRRLVLSGANFDLVAEDDVVLKNCDGDIATSPDGIVYYSNQTEIRRLITD